MKKITEKIRTTSICLVTATAIALPGVSQAGWFSNVHPVKKVVKKARTTASAGLSAIQAKVNDVSNKVNSIYAQLENSAPLLDAIKDADLINELKGIIDYIDQARADYQQFADSGINVFESDMTGLLYGFGDMGKNMKLGNDLEEKLDKIHNLLADLPPQLMYVLNKIMGPSIKKINEDVQALNERLQVVANLPSNRELMKDPEKHKLELCPIVNDTRTKVTYAIIKARLKLLAVNINYVNGMIPDEIEVNANAVAGGGTSVPNPAKAVSKTIKMIADRGIQRYENAGEIAKAVCED